MTPFGDNPDEMPRNAVLDERSIEAILAGDPDASHPELSAFVADMRRVSAGPVPAPSAALSDLFLHGFSTEKGDLPATAASNVTGPASQVAGLPKWRKYTMAVKQFIAGLSIAGKLMMGAGVAAAATTGAGSVGVLPDPVQHEFARAVDGLVPFTVEDPTPASELGEPGPIADAPDAARVASTTTVAPPAAPPVAPSTTAVAPTPPAAAPTPGNTTDEAVAPPTTATPPTTAVPAPPVAPPSTTAAPRDGYAITLTLRCEQNGGWTGVNCAWKVLTPTGSDHYVLVRIAPDGEHADRMWGEGVSSYTDVHADTIGATYRYTLLAKDADGRTVGRSSEVSVTIVAR